VGGGMLTDLCGFAASTFKRGIDFINIPTTLLSQVDASVGGKTGFNFNGLKNEIGTFSEPRMVLIHTPFLTTIDNPNFLSGYAEMVKHGLIFNAPHFNELLEFDVRYPDFGILPTIIQHSVEVKKHFVTQDPTEKNIRKALNFGHTAGHAIESLAMEQNRPVLHGYAVAWGMVVELYLSFVKRGFSDYELNRISTWLKDLYGTFNISEADFDRLYQLMQHDKKNEANRINFTLIPEIGKFEIDCYCQKEEIFASLRFLQQL
jgi:3-dehydroquinate synthase